MVQKLEVSAQNKELQKSELEVPTSPLKPSCIILDTPIKNNMQILANKKHTSLSRLLNVAAEIYLQRYVEQEQEREKKITVTSQV